MKRLIVIAILTLLFILDTAYLLNAENPFVDCEKKVEQEIYCEFGCRAIYAHTIVHKWKYDNTILVEFFDNHKIRVRKFKMDENVMLIDCIDKPLVIESMNQKPFDKCKLKERYILILPNKK